MDEFYDLTCEHCYKIFPNITRLRRHTTAHKQAYRKELGSVHRKKLKTSTPVLICGECDRVFKHTMTLKRHERYHEKVRNQTCPECGMVFRSESYLLAHLFRSHSILPAMRNDITIKMDCPTAEHTSTLVQTDKDTDIRWSHYRNPSCTKRAGSSRYIDGSPRSIDQSNAQLPLFKRDQVASGLELKSKASPVCPTYGMPRIFCGQESPMGERNTNFDYLQGLDIVATNVLINLIFLNIQNSWSTFDFLSNAVHVGEIHQTFGP